MEEQFGKYDNFEYLPAIRTNTKVFGIATNDAPLQRVIDQLKFEIENNLETASL